MSETVYLNDDNRDMMSELMEIGQFSSKTELLTKAFQSLRKELVKEDMRHKYETGETGDDALEQAQFETIDRE